MYVFMRFVLYSFDTAFICHLPEFVIQNRIKGALQFRRLQLLAIALFDSEDPIPQQQFAAFPGIKVTLSGLTFD